MADSTQNVWVKEDDQVEPRSGQNMKYVHNAPWRRWNEIDGESDVIWYNIFDISRSCERVDKASDSKSDSISGSLFNSLFNSLFISHATSGKMILIACKSSWSHHLEKSPSSAAQTDGHSPLSDRQKICRDNQLEERASSCLQLSIIRSESNPRKKKVAFADSPSVVWGHGDDRCPTESAAGKSSSKNSSCSGSSSDKRRWSLPRNGPFDH